MAILQPLAAGLTAQGIIEDAHERCNRLSPGESLGGDDLARGLRRLNLLVDELSAQALFLFQSVSVSAAQTGAIVLGLGDWDAIATGSQIVGARCNGIPLSPATPQQYGQIAAPDTVGTPSLYAPDGLDVVRLYPVPSGQRITLQTRQGVTAFTGLDAEYLMPPGYASALGAALAVRIAPAIMGSIPQYLLTAEAQAMRRISRYEPAILDQRSPF
jgi:hypothetical protein